MGGAAKLKIHGDNFIGAYCITSENISMTGYDLRKKDIDVFLSTLKTTPEHFTLGGSDLIGLFSRINSNGILLSNISYSSEVKKIKDKHRDLNVQVLESDLNAIGNNILLNDKLAIVNPDYKENDIKIISDIFGVEVLKMEIAGYKTVGAHNILTNKGMVVNNNVEDEEFKKLKEISKNISQSTANLGSLSIGLCAIANSNGVIFGKDTSGYEMASIQDGLDIE